MAITDKEQGVWELDEVYNKINEGGIWSYTDPAGLYTWGDNGDGRLGQNNPDNSHRSSPVQMPGFTKVFNTNPGNSKYLLFSKNSGDLWGVGESYEGALGLNDGTASHRSSPVQIGTSTDWSNVVGGDNMTIATKTNGTLWIWGDNNYGSLGNNQSSPGNRRSSPIQIGTDTTWTTNISNGQNAGWAIKTNGTLWAWGNNQQYGALGLNQNGPGTNISSPAQVGTDTTWSSLGAAAGSGGIMAAFKTDGTMWVWGRQYGGTLGLNQGTADNNNSRSSPTQLPGTWASVSVGANSMMGTKTNGTLWSWGMNQFGQLGQNTVSPGGFSSPVQIGTSTDWSKVSGNQRGGYTAAALKTDGTFWAWGNNHKGELGQDNITQRSSPTQIPGTWDSFNSTGWHGNIAAIKGS